MQPLPPEQPKGVAPKHATVKYDDPARPACLVCGAGAPDPGPSTSTAWIWQHEQTYRLGPLCSTRCRDVARTWDRQHAARAIFGDDARLEYLAFPLSTDRIHRDEGNPDADSVIGWKAVQAVPGCRLVACRDCTSMMAPTYWTITGAAVERALRQQATEGGK